ncbi:efflux RND transporter periplasmic adaptor subunit [Halomonas shantousis]
MRLTTMNKSIATMSVVLLALLLSGCGGSEEDSQQAQQGEGQNQPPQPAQVMTVQPRDVQLEKSYPALLRSEQQVTVVARVTGVLEERHYTEGARVEKGELLFTIEPARYEAAVRQREADLQSAKAEQSRAQRNWERYQSLYKQNSVSQQQLDEARATLQTAQASVAQAQAALDDAQLDLDYTTVEAPVSGQISLSEVDVGNLVQPQQELATITPMQTLEARFSLPEEDAVALRRQRRIPDAPEVSARLKAPSLGPDLQGEGLKGRIEYLGSRVDESTSTVQAEAVFDNEEQLFLPGQFVRVALEGLQRFQVLAVPEVAITEGLKGPQLFVLDDDNKATSRFVDLGEPAGDWQIIMGNLQPGERVVVSAIGSISAGDKIDPQPFDGDPEVIQEEDAQTTGGDNAQAENAEPRGNQETGAKSDTSSGTAPAQNEQG